MMGFCLCLLFNALTISLFVAGLGTSETKRIGLISSARLLYSCTGILPSFTLMAISCNSGFLPFNAFLNSSDVPLPPSDFGFLNLSISSSVTPAALTENADYTGMKILVRNHGANNRYNQEAVTHAGGTYFNVLFDDGNGASTYMTHAHVDTDWQYFISGSYMAS